jgi:hypothetical protein
MARFHGNLRATANKIPVTTERAERSVMLEITFHFRAPGAYAASHPARRHQLQHVFSGRMTTGKVTISASAMTPAQPEYDLNCDTDGVDKQANHDGGADKMSLTNRGVTDAALGVVFSQINARHDAYRGVPTNVASDHQERA